MGLVVPLFTEIGLRGLVRGLLDSGMKFVVFKEERLTGLARLLVACLYQNHARVTDGSGLLRSSVGRLCGLVRGSLGLARQLTYVRVQARRGACTNFWLRPCWMLRFYYHSGIVSSDVLSFCMYIHILCISAGEVVAAVLDAVGGGTEFKHLRLPPFI